MLTKSPNSKNIVELSFFVGTFVVSFVTMFYIIVAAMHADGLKSAFIFSHPTITNILIIIVLFMNITKYKDSKAYYWFVLTTLISSSITLISASKDMAADIDSLMNRRDYYNYFFRLHKIILPSLYLIFYIFLDKQNSFERRSILVIFIYPLIYLLAIQMLTMTIGIQGRNSFNLLQNIFSLRTILPIVFGFLPLTPSVLGIMFLKEELMHKANIRKGLLFIGICLIIISLGSFWYPSPFSKMMFHTFSSRSFATNLQQKYLYKWKI